MNTLLRDPGAPTVGQPQPYPGADAAPRTWLVLGDKAGDNGQVEVLAEALGWPCERRFVAMKPEWVLGKPEVRPTLDHIDPARSDPLAPPWPDLILTIGRRPSAVALWVRAQSDGRTRIVLVGKPSAPIEWFDLVVTSGENQLPPLPNVLRIGLPLMRVDRAAVAAAAEAWRPRLADLPRPLVGLLIGGATGPFVFDRSVADRLVQLAAAVVAEGGTPYLTTSRRTPAWLVDDLRDRLPAGARLFAWQADAADNPYRALLGLADGLVVTGDSVSMLVEVARLGRPLALLPLPQGSLGRLDQARRALTRRLFTAERGPALALARAAYRLRLLTQTRDFEAFHHMLLARGLAVRAGEPFRPPAGDVADDVQAVVARIHPLMAQGTAGFGPTR